LASVLNEEVTEHLGHEKHDPAGAGTGNIRNGRRAKTVLTEHSGLVEGDALRDCPGTFEPKIVRKRQRRLDGVDEVRHRRGTASTRYGISSDTRAGLGSDPSCKIKRVPGERSRCRTRSELLTGPRC
jgi:hypothetical protein